MINRKLQLGISFFITLLFMLFFRKVDEAWNNRRFLLFIEYIHINANKSEESIQNPRIGLQLKKKSKMKIQLHAATTNSYNSLAR